MGRRGPQSGLRQASTAAEAEQWLRLFEALGSAHAGPLLHHLSLRVADVPALLDVCPRATASLRRILAETSGGAALDQVNGVLAAAYGEMESRLGARLARSVFALASEGFPGAGEERLMQRWEGPLHALVDDFAACGLPESKRDVVTSIVAHHVAAADALRADAAQPAVDGGDAERQRWLLTLVRWRRFASLSRALARVLSPAERERLATYTRRGESGPLHERTA